MIKNRKKLIDARKKCMDAKVGETIVCPSCGTEHVKKSYQSVFCKTKGRTRCKDNFWNNVDSNKRNNITRISPASAAWMARQEELRDERGYDYEDDHPFSGDALGQWND